jgi:hypothetical protein
LHIWKARINIWLGFAAFCYLLGLALIAYYVASFPWNSYN